MRARISLSTWMSVVPMAALVWLMAYAALAYLHVGHWPMYSRPDPTSIGPWVTGYVLMGGLLVFMGMLPPGPRGAGLGFVA